MLMTLGVKNLFGCIVGLRKPQWHFRTGVSREMFATLLVKIHNAVNPAFTIVDGILAMEGEGPGRSGIPRELGIIAGSNDAIALDMSVCDMLELAEDRVFTNRAAKDMGFAPDDREVLGEMPGIKNFKFPEIVPVVFGPKRFHGFMRRHLVQRPVPEGPLCRMCGECWKYCPAEAITRGKEEIHIDYDRCIRCYCCIEVCPHGALRAEEPLVGRAIRKLKGL
jgi:ferredoxin